MKKLITLTIGAIGLTALTLGGIAVANPGGHHGPPGVEGQIMRLVRDLDLTDEQKTVLREIHEENRAEREALRGDREADMAIVKEQLLSDTPDAVLLHQMIDDRAADMQARAHDRLDTVLEVQAILTPTQRAQIATELEEAKERMGERRRRFRNGEGPRFERGPRFDDE